MKAIKTNNGNKSNIYLSLRNGKSWIHSVSLFIPFYFPAFKGITEPEYLVSTFLIAGAIGTILGGPFADRYGGRNGLLASMIISLIAIYPFLQFSNNWASFLAFIVGAALISTFSTTVVFGQRLLPNSIGLASGLILGFGVGMGSIGVTILGAIVICRLPFMILLPPSIWDLVLALLCLMT